MNVPNVTNDIDGSPGLPFWPQYQIGNFRNDAPNDGTDMQKMVDAIIAGKRWGYWVHTEWMQNGESWVVPKDQSLANFCRELFKYQDGYNDWAYCDLDPITGNPAVEEPEDRIRSEIWLARDPTIGRTTREDVFVPIKGS